LKTQESFQPWTGGVTTVLKTPDVKSISLEDVAKLLAQAEKEGRQVMVLPPPEKPLQNLIGGPDGLNPGPGKRLVAKSIPTQNQVSTLHDYEHSPNEFEQQPNGLIPGNQIVTDLFEDFDKNGSTTFSQDQVNAGEILGEFNLPVSTQVLDNTNTDNLQNLVFNSLNDDQDQVLELNPSSLQTNNDCWSETSLFLDGQHQDEDLTTHLEPSLVTGQTMPVNELNIHKITTISSGMTTLERYVLDPSIAPDSKEFKEFVAIENISPKEITLDLSEIDGSVVGPSTSVSGQQVDTFDIQSQPPVKRGRGRPRKIKTEPDPPKKPRGRPATAPEWAQIDEYDSSSSMSSDEKTYRRMRDLNNAASKRCRLGRKRKSEEDENKAFELATKNVELKCQVEELESQVKKFKSIIFDMIQKQRTNSIVTVPKKIPKVETKTKNFDFTKYSTSQQHDPEDLTFLDDL